MAMDSCTIYRLIPEVIHLKVHFQNIVFFLETPSEGEIYYEYVLHNPLICEKIGENQACVTVTTVKKCFF